MKFKNSISKLIEMRSSYRNYDTRPIDHETRNTLEGYMETARFDVTDTRMRFQIVDADPENKLIMKQYGTYGVINGAPSYIIGAVQEGPYALVDFGYVFEKVVLCATDLGLGTCWMAGTFNRSNFADQISLKPGEILSAISPIGFAAERRTFRDSLVRTFIGAKNRKPWTSMFFDGDFKKPLKREDTPFDKALEGVRLAPSAVNLQPWRVVKAAGKNVYHFYLQRSSLAKMATEVDFQSLDMGIAICHFEMVLEELGVKGNWVIQNPELPLPNTQTEYIITYQA